MRGNGFTWRGSRGSGGRLGGCWTVVILHLRAQVTYSDPALYHAPWPNLPLSPHLGQRTHHFVGCLLGAVLWVGFTEVRNLRINHTESVKRESAKALDPFSGPLLEASEKFRYRMNCTPL